MGVSLLQRRAQYLRRQQEIALLKIGRWIALGSVRPMRRHDQPVFTARRPDGVVVARTVTVPSLFVVATNRPPLPLVELDSKRPTLRLTEVTSSDAVRVATSPVVPAFAFLVMWFPLSQRQELLAA